ncbi:hypothetical protein B0T25DRAFT_292953 [Lasiosphaeria hispida]|uniref:BTB domain-containing protein n=1 Tax=Lasiosphaeria hispida TaxID=260671 RepID=A0AAJ0HCD5_9PEZI|nr:hypothetical protein B0T25DRAFT_292953 [Lasiosphaeria hispida]
MEGKQNSGGNTAAAAGKMEDSFFGKSSFSSGPLITLQFRHGDHLTVHRALLLRHPKLLALVGNQSPGIWAQPPPDAAALKHISRSAGHVLVNYLYTDTYGTLKWVGPGNGREETAAKLKTGFEVYAAARKYELGGLEDLAKEQVSLLSKELDAFAIVAVVNEVYPTSTDEDTWFPGFMKTVVKTAFEGSAALLESEARKPVGGGPQGGFSTAVTLLRSALEAYQEIARDGSAEAEPSQPTDDASEWRTTARKEKRKGGHYMYCSWDVAQELVKLGPEEPAPTEDAASEETAAEAAPAIETSAEEAPLEEPYPEQAYPQEACAEEAPIAAESPPEETPELEETAWPARLDLVPNNICGLFNPSTMKKGKREKEKKRRKGAVYRKPYTEDSPPEEPEPTPEPEGKSGVAFGNDTDSGFFSGGSTTSFVFSFRPTDKAAIDDIPSTASAAFTPTTKQESFDP